MSVTTESSATTFSHVTMLHDWELHHSIFHNLDRGGRADSISLFKVVLDMYDQPLSRTKYFADDHYSLADLVHIPKLMN
ncbi:unnamed protein product [Sphagnum compactum]